VRLGSAVTFWIIERNFDPTHRDTRHTKSSQACLLSLLQQLRLPPPADPSGAHPENQLPKLNTRVRFPSRNGPVDSRGRSSRSASGAVDTFDTPDTEVAPIPLTLTPRTACRLESN